MDLFNELSEAVRSGNVEEIEKLKRKILLVGRDESLDKNFINSIKGKTLYKNLNRFIHNHDIDNYECAKMITSLITHLIIESMVRGSDIRNYPLSDLYIVLGEFISDPDSKSFREKCFNVLADRYLPFIESEKEEVVG